jgi:hypothetical protein
MRLKVFAYLLLFTSIAQKWTKRFALAFLLWPSLLVAQTVPSAVLPARIPTRCAIAGKALGDVPNSCLFETWPGMTQILVGQNIPNGVVDTEGSTWIKDFCVSFDNDCIYHTIPAQQLYPSDEYIKFAPGEGYSAVVMLYAGTWAFDQANCGSYAIAGVAACAGQNTPFADCPPGGDCPYWWTLPVEVDAGELLIEWGNSAATGPGVIVPGFGYNLESSDGKFAVADMIAPIAGVYVGSMQANNPDGSQGGGSHWLLGVAAFQQVPSVTISSAAKRVKEK